MDANLLWYAIRDTMEVLLVSAPLTVIVWGMWECIRESMEEESDA